MHVLIRERHGLEEASAPEDLRQPPGDLVVLSFSDSDLGALAAGWRASRGALPSLRLANLRRLVHPQSVDLYVERTLSGAKAILVRLLGGADYWPYGLDEVRRLAMARGIALAVVPGDGRRDPRLDAASTVPAATLRRLGALLDAGGALAAQAALAELARAAGLPAPPAAPVVEPPRHGFYMPGGALCPVAAPVFATERPKALVVFYRAWLAAADCEPVDALIAALDARGFAAAGLFAGSLKDPESAGWIRRWVARLAPDVIVNATAFSARDGDASSPFDVCDAPVLQVALAGSDRSAWAGSDRGLSPADLAMHVVLPEVDGRVFAGVVSFKAPEAADAELGFERLVHRADAAAVAAVAGRAAAFAALRRKPAADKRLALVLSTYPGRPDQTAHAVGLDAPESAVEVLSRLAEAGYAVAGAPGEGGALVARVLAERQAWPLAAYRAALARLPPGLRDALAACWGDPQDDPACVAGAFAFPAARCGAVLVALQPERGEARDRAADYHDPRRPPRHAYVAFHLWLREAERIDALIHMGAHGTLEWLPGKSVALSDACWPQALVGATPVVYPFIVNDPGEAAAAKRRLGAVTIGHLTPPLARGAMPDDLRRIETLLDEYSNADGLDPRRRDRLAASILRAARESGLAQDAGLAEDAPQSETLARLDAFVCDVKATQFGDGLHVFGVAPDLSLMAAEGLDPRLSELPFAESARSEIRALLGALAGRAVPPGPAGSPWRGRADVLPTGRNLFAVDPRAVPSRDAHRQGVRLADALLTRHLQDHGDHPRHVVVDLWGSATMRTAGEDFAMALALIGVAPVWDHSSDRVSGFEIAPLAALGRPRIDVTLRVSGLFRDVFPNLPVLFEQAIAALRARDEPAADNPFRAGDDPRVFGPAPGAYGAGVVAATGGELTDAAATAAGEAWLAASSHAFGGGVDGAPARAALERRVRDADAFLHMQDLPETDLLLAPDYAAHEAGFAAAARALGAAAPALYHADATHPDALRVRTLREELARVVRGRAASPRWIAGQMRHDFRGAAEIAWTLDQMAAFAHLAQALESRHFDLYHDATLGDEAVRAFMERANPEALAAMRARFEALIAAGLWRPLRNSVALSLGVAAE